METTERLWHLVYYQLRSILLILMLIGWVVSLSAPRGLRWTFSAFVLAYLIIELTFSLLQGPEYRYQMPGIAMTAFVGGQGLWMLVLLVCRSGKYAFNLSHATSQSRE